MRDNVPLARSMRANPILGQALISQTATCHGEYGTGSRESIKRGDLTDSRGFVIAAADLTALASFKNGASPEDLYRTLVTGLDGTLMPSSAHSFEGQEEDLWHLVNSLLSLSASLP